MHITINSEQTEFPYHLPDGQVKIKVIAIPYIILYNYVKVIRQFGYFLENLLTMETTRWTTLTYIM